MKTSETIKDLATALAKAQGEILGAPRDSENPFFKSHYADLDSCREAMREAFAKNGLSLTQETLQLGSEPALGAMLMHSSGQWIQYDPIVVPVKEKNNPQALKSGITYMRRAQLLAICAMSEKDDDGEAATQPVSKPPLKNYASSGDGVMLMPFGKTKGTPLDKLPKEDVISAIAWAKKTGKFQDFIVKAEAFLVGGPRDIDDDFGPPPDDQIPF